MIRLGLVVVAAGSSDRMAGIDKVWAKLGDRPVVYHSLQRLSPRAQVVVLVVRPGQELMAERELLLSFPHLLIVPGGAERQESVARGLAALHDVELAAVHDAARPFASAALLDAGVVSLGGAAGAIPVQPVPDTVKRVADERRVVETLDRRDLRLVQTPQIFRLEALRAAHGSAAAGRPVTDDASLLEAVGGMVATFPGEPANFKLTTQYDLHVARLLVEHGFPL